MTIMNNAVTVMPHRAEIEKNVETKSIIIYRCRREECAGEARIGSVSRGLPTNARNVSIDAECSK